VSDLGLTGRTALVTGATKGIGLAIARKLRSCGCHVVLNYAHDDEAAKAAVDGLDGLPGSSVLAKADITGQEGVEELVAAVGPGLDVLVHNAASWHPMPAAKADLTGLHADVGTALDPLLRLAPALPGLMPGGGRVVAVSSSGATRAIPGYVGLGVAKAAMEALVRYLAVELAGRGIAVNAVSTAKVDKGPGTPNAEMLPMLAARTPAGRVTVPEDVADAVALLCADEAAWIHGQVITVDGGLAIRA
jgi:enoyl-[acyl-carrier protein] reductase III